MIDEWQVKKNTHQSQETLRLIGLTSGEKFTNVGGAQGNDAGTRGRMTEGSHSHEGNGMSNKRPDHKECNKSLKGVQHGQGTEGIGGSTIKANSEWTSVEGHRI